MYTALTNDIKLRRNDYVSSVLSVLATNECAKPAGLVTLAASSGKRNVTVWRSSVCLSRRHKVKYDVKVLI